MNRLLAVLDRLFPSVPRGLAATIPGPGVRDHQHPGAGTTPAARPWELAVLRAWRKATR